MFRPRVSRYLVGALLGAFVGAGVFVTAGMGTFEAGPSETWLPFIVFVTPFMYALFVVVGFPLFLLLRGTRWFRFPLAALVGALLGFSATALYGGPGWDRVTVGFTAIGVLSTAVCWWFMHLSRAGQQEIEA